MTDDEAAVYDFCIQLHRTRKVDEATFNRAQALLGEQGVVDLIGVGYYTAVSMTLNVAQVMLPEASRFRSSRSTARRASERAI
jgi:4-carboxymuconolactone decarboxylase